MISHLWSFLEFCKSAGQDVKLSRQCYFWSTLRGERATQGRLHPVQIQASFAVYNVDLINLGPTWSLLCADCTMEKQTESQPTLYVPALTLTRRNSVISTIPVIGLVDVSRNPSFRECQNFIAVYFWTCVNWMKYELKYDYKGRTSCNAAEETQTLAWNRMHPL